MSDSITTTSREIARAVLSYPFDPGVLALSVPREAVQLAIENYRAAMLPAARRTKAERQEDQQTLAKIIRSIGARLRPDFTEDQAKLWIASIIEALEDQPLRIALAAARDVLRMPVRFPGDVHPSIVERCGIHAANYHRAIANLETVLFRIDQPPALTASPEAQAKADLMSLDELQSMPPAMRSLGVSGGWLVEEPDLSLRWATDAEQERRRRRFADERHIARARGRESAGS